MKTLSVKTQARNTAKTIRLLTTCGFKPEHEKSGVYLLRLQYYNDAHQQRIRVSPPTTRCQSWQIMVENKDEAKWIGGDGTLSFHVQFANPQRVIASIMEHFYQKGFQNGCAITTKRFTIPITVFTEAVKHMTYR